MVTPREKFHGLDLRVDPRMPIGWIGTLDERSGEWIATNGAVFVRGNTHNPGEEFPSPSLENA